MARRYLAPLVASGIDTLVLGCTHYPLLRDAIAEVMGPEVTLVDSAAAVAEVVAADLLRHQLASDADGDAEHHFCVTDAGSRFARIGASFLGAESLSLEWVDV